MNLYLTLWILCHLTLIGCTFGYSEGIQIGCANWRTDGDNVCCIECRPGNRLVTRCGPDPTKLCEPCGANKFITNPKKRFCDVCRHCIEPQFEVKPCSANADRVCGCNAGLLCGDQRCSFCVDECGMGQEPVGRGCRTCPEGTFNDKIHSSCKKWSSRCPDDEVLVDKGNAVSDITCSKKTSVPTEPPVPKVQKDGLEYNTVETQHSKTRTPDDAVLPIIGIAVGFSVAAIILILSLWLAHRTRKNKTKAEIKTVTQTETMDPMPETLPSAEFRVIMVRSDDACSFRQPEQEQGGSLESIDSEDSVNSETKLME